MIKSILKLKVDLPFDQVHQVHQHVLGGLDCPKGGTRSFPQFYMLGVEKKCEHFSSDSRRAGDDCRVREPASKSNGLAQPRPNPESSGDAAGYLNPKAKTDE